ncbi:MULTISPECIES: glycosyltransferase family 2 protein [unclassified Rhizobium]|uniref:glycosyltransferase family 2 protein n=1 Tax=unclassified Rhizobium TaxID=2613769 RepID=UPI00161895E2|nr:MULTISPECIES: glycosyltransferase family 2 protein [unclassified Rhizobium]MBB3386634.1 dolichol-phosphate mannosyltransferase [Rhizobium sp. BK098]MBB3618338.1 dolichol-phosphate mannosyltransferase [Rhizobium sp. BK609]MBB3683995.1 dolichol-phosphate mannosyltransferase [Rhizobium sp. BK612]
MTSSRLAPLGSWPGDRAIIKCKIPQQDGIELSIVIPTFNERENIVPLIERLRAALVGIAWEVIFVDDDSSDKTVDVVRSLSLGDRRIRGIRRIHRRGLAGACLEGMLSTSAPIVAVMDADLQHDETRLVDMLAMMRSNCTDLVVATRYGGEGSSQEGFNRIRQAGSHIAVRIAKRLLNVETSDPMSGFFMVKRALIEELAPKLSQQGFKILLDIIASSPAPLKLGEVSYVFRPRIHGESKLDASVIFEYIGLLVAKWSGDIISSRMLLFGLVGMSGLVVHLTILRLLLLGGLAFSVSQATAMLAAVISNYTFNNAITYRDRRRGGVRFLTGLMLFSTLCSIGIFAGTGVSSLFYSQEPRWWLAGLAGAIIGAGWNYITSSMITWRRPG